jgi:tRNA(Arg) A34 adenosine deaminase TadA
MSDNKTFLRMALALAKKGMDDGCGGPFGAVIVKNGEVIGQGFNRVTSINDPTAHAEVVAIRDACNHLNTYQLTGCTIYSSCEPCPMCLGAIYWARPDKLVYASTKEDAAAIGFDDAFIYKEIQLDKTDRKIETINILREEGKKVFDMWDAKTDKLDY